MVVLFIKTFQNSWSKVYKKSKRYPPAMYWIFTQNVIQLGWLPIIEGFEFNATKLAFKVFHCPEWPDCLPLKFHKSNYRVTILNHKNTFKSDAYRCSNDLPLDLRQEINNKKSGGKSFFINKALARLS